MENSTQNCIRAETQSSTISSYTSYWRVKLKERNSMLFR